MPVIVHPFCKSFFIICDRYADISKKAVVIWVDDSLNTSEDYLGYYQILNIKGDTIAEVIKDSFIFLRLPTINIRCQT